MFNRAWLTDRRVQNGGHEQEAHHGAEEDDQGIVPASKAPEGEEENSCQESQCNGGAQDD